MSDIFKELDAILAWVPIKDTRNFYHIWKGTANERINKISDPKMTIKNTLTGKKPADVVKLYWRVIMNFINKTIKSPKNNIELVNHIAEYLELDTYDKFLQTNKVKNTKKAAIDYCNWLKTKFIIPLTKITRSPSFDATELALQLYEYNNTAFNKTINEDLSIIFDTEKKLNDTKIYGAGANFLNEYKNQKQDASKLYEDFFRKHGGKWRIMPEELRIGDSTSLINRFNYLLLKVTKEYFQYALKKEDEANTIRAWLKAHPVKDFNGGTLDIDADEVPTDDLYYPKTPIDYYGSEDKCYISMYVPPKNDKGFVVKPRHYAIGKILTWARDKGPYPTLAHLLSIDFNDHSLENIKRSIVTVISRHIYDIVGQSTNRLKSYTDAHDDPNGPEGWTSCQNIYGNLALNKYVPSGAVSGNLVAYVCYSDDTKIHMGANSKKKDGAQYERWIETNDGTGKGKVNIQHPIARVLIKPWVRHGEKINYDDPNYLLLVSQPYRQDYPKVLLKKLQLWFDRNWNDAVLEKSKNRTYTWLNTTYQDPPEQVGTKTF